MSWLREHAVPKMFQIMMLLFVVAIAADDLAFQAASLNVTPTLQQALCNDDSGDTDRHTLKAPKYLSRNDYDVQRLHLVIRNYLEQFNGYLIPSSPSIFFQPDRAPPVSFQ
jgi:hypothetical protein